MSEADAVHDEVQRLVWALVDEYITDEEFARLESLLTGDAAARETYVQCMQLHANLHYLLNDDAEKNAREAIARVIGADAPSPIPPLASDDSSTGHTPMTGSEPVA